LLYRLNVIEIEMCPLRERPSDIAPLAEHLLLELASLHNRPARTFSAEAMRMLITYPWPGNIRELRNAVERAVLLSTSPEILPDVLPMKVVSTGSQGEPTQTDRTPLAATLAVPAAEPQACGAMPTLDEVEEAHIRHVLDICPNLEEAAKTLGIDQTTLYRRRKRYGLV
jgi:NtrC-family two-component system response regulator AlgB